MNDKLNRRDLLKLAGMGTRSRPRRYVGICATGDVDTDPGAGRQFTPLLIFATNIDPKELVDDAFLRRIGYRSYVTPPTREMYAEIFKNYVESTGFLSETGLIDFVLRCYEHEQRPLRGCEPRDLVQRCIDMCDYESRQRVVTRELIQLAWKNYFGTVPAVD